MAMLFKTNITIEGSVSVIDEAYGLSWDGSLQVPTKNAIYDKIETLSTQDLQSVLDQGGSYNPSNPTSTSSILISLEGSEVIAPSLNIQATNTDSEGFIEFYAGSSGVRSVGETVPSVGVFDEAKNHVGGLTRSTISHRTNYGVDDETKYEIFLKPITNEFYLETQQRTGAGKLLRLNIPENSNIGTVNLTLPVPAVGNYTLPLRINGVNASPNGDVTIPVEPPITGADANTVWHGNKTFSPVVEADISLSDNVTNNVSTLRHGFMSKLPGGTTIFYRGDGAFASPASVTVPNAYIIEAFTGTSYNLIHNFGSYPVVQILDSTGAVVIPLSIVNNTVNDLTVTFTSAGTYSVIATIGSPQLQNYVSVSTNYTALTTDKIIEVTAPSVTITLPTTSVTNTGFEYKIDNSSNGDILVVGESGETIQGLTEQVLPSNSSMNVYSNGVSWRIT